LTLLSAGNVGPDASLHLYSARLAEIFDFAKKNFDIVLVDSPPLLQIPDARVMGQAADAVLIVVRSGKTTREAALAVRRKLAEDGTRMTGSVLNDWNPKIAPRASETHPRST
jgi:succinoglycan biosynthesis transport protein ExoP